MTGPWNRYYMKPWFLLGLGLLLVQGMWMAGRSHFTRDQIGEPTSGTWLRRFQTINNPQPVEGSFADKGLNALFRVYQDLPMNYKCEGYGIENQPCSACEKFQPLMRLLGENEAQSKKPNLFFVPMDYLAILPPTSPSFSARIESVMDNLVRRPDYLRFGGSDHILLCISAGCADVMREVIERHPLGKDTRAMWAAPAEMTKGLEQRWPCPDRVFSLPEELVKIAQNSPTESDCKASLNMSSLVQDVNSLLNVATNSIDGLHRWACSRPKWKVDLSSLKGRSDQGCFLVKRHNVCFTAIPKTASSTIKMLLKRMDGIPDWKTGSIHNPKYNGLTKTHAKRNYTEYVRSLTSTNIVKVAILRNPANRFRSGYVDKIYQLHEFWRIKYKGKEVPTLPAVAGHFMKLKREHNMRLADEHFRPQIEFASLHLIRYDFIAYVSTLAEDIETILRSLDLWEVYGASGWGANGTLSFVEYTGRNRGVWAPNSTYHTPFSIRQVQTIYREDYEKFGFSMALPGNLQT